TGIVPVGGIPLLDSLLRPELYQNGNTPASTNQQTITNLQSAGLAASAFNGTYADTANSPSKQASGQSPQPPSNTDTGTPPDNSQPGQIPDPTPVPDGGDLGIVATPGG